MKNNGGGGGGGDSGAGAGGVVEGVSGFRFCVDDVFSEPNSVSNRSKIELATRITLQARFKNKD